MMEQKRMLLATGSCQGEGPCTVNMIDRFSNLPEGVFHHILSKFSIKDLARFCCVSKRWRELCLSSPSVEFCGFSEDGIMDMACELRLKLVNALDRFLLSRGDNEMKSFVLFWDGHSDEELDEACFCVNENFRIITWIQNAVRCKVEKVYLDVTFFDYEGEPLAFPSCVFRSASLTSIVVNMPRTVVKTPSFTFSSNIEKLHLSDVVIQDEGFFEWISYSCKSLKDVTLSAVREIHSITIESSSLEKFYFINYEVDETCHINISGEKLEEINVRCNHSPSSTILKIVAPNVKRLLLEGNVKNHLNLGELKCLEQAAILMEPIVDEFNKVFEVLSSLCSVEVLVLNEATIQAAYREECVQAQLDETWYLQMNIGSFTDDLVPAVVSLLRGTPELCTLYIRYKPTSLDPKSNTSGFDMEYWKMQNLDFVSQVEDVTIELSAGFNGIELARYILEHAESLEKMVIRYLAEQSNAIGKLKESKMISNPLVTFEEYDSSVTLF
ncbi:putative F-box domain, leucine-rich repeat domain, L domain-containing protein [Rosa chinensis]|uniref:Putative F-box domain, leucine-rich repeat domain, L domain-containing protein n=1 Tax=Rosa chinensis TaxID=74649 RepID=A0A2P6RC15_ROSCH|nr:putative F-box/FBD/LRR-repeat protein At5g44950 [Rosa chinensis]XP_024191330.1 putative F-box/FBD/LRR-repeat protein At5g44950 [Rosa chinensis]PRQ43965.1 putative F-box domain, leucine-rich repeat domain, L domain-containing protein [Rosa chinensis]